MFYRALAPACKTGNSLALFTFANVTLKTAKYAKESQNKENREKWADRESERERERGI